MNDVGTEMDALGHMTTGDLAERYAELTQKIIDQRLRYNALK